MCLAMPAKVTRLKDHQMATVNLGGIEKEISLVLVDGVNVGDYVIIHVGYALTKMNVEEAEKTLTLFSQMTALIYRSSEK